MSGGDTWVPPGGLGNDPAWQKKLLGSFWTRG
jgi:hypothetical protein